MQTEMLKAIVEVALATALVLAALIFVAGNGVLAFVMYRLVRFLLVQVLWANNFVSRQLSKSGQEYVARAEADQRAAGQETRPQPFEGQEEPQPDMGGGGPGFAPPEEEPTRGVPPPR